MGSFLVKKFVLLLILSFFQQIHGQCVDEVGKSVDWSIIYKLPKNSEELKPKHRDIIEDGLGYMYLTSETQTNGWILSKLSVKDVNSIPGRVLSPIYGMKNNSGLFTMFYNDEHPEGNTSFTLGHTKGVLVMNEDMGFWLVHSVPKFPPSLTENNLYDYPHTGQMYGQSFLCISLNTSTSADQIGLQMMYNQPYLYSVNIPDWVEKKYPNLAKAGQKKRIKNPPYYNMITFKSLDGLSFTSFAKSKKFGKDLYADFVAPTLQLNLMVETWPNGPGKMNSSCDLPFHVLNVDALDFKSTPEVHFVTKKDHAKWAVSYSTRKTILGLFDVLLDQQRYVCIGDINRMNTQKKRGGGTVCFQNAKAWKAFTSIIKTVEVCPK